MNSSCPCNSTGEEIRENIVKYTVVYLNTDSYHHHRFFRFIHIYVRTFVIHLVKEHTFMGHLETEKQKYRCV